MTGLDALGELHRKGLVKWRMLQGGIGDIKLVHTNAACAAAVFLDFDQENLCKLVHTYELYRPMPPRRFTSVGAFKSIERLLLSVPLGMPKRLSFAAIFDEVLTCILSQNQGTFFVVGSVLDIKKRLVTDNEVYGGTWKMSWQPWVKLSGAATVHFVETVQELDTHMPKSFLIAPTFSCLGRLKPDRCFVC